MKTFKIAATTVALTLTAMMAPSAQAGNGRFQTRIRIQPQPHVYPAPVRLSLGIHGQASRRHGIHGVRVVRDTMHRPLLVRLPCGTLQTAYFRCGYDIITSVNGRHVDRSRDITNALKVGYNTLTVYDSYTRSWSTVQVDIHGHVAHRPNYPMPVVPAPIYPAIAPGLLQP